MDKLAFKGAITAVQPRIRLTRSFDEATHSYLGYAIVLEGTIGEEEREFSIGVGKAAHEKHRFRIGDQISGFCRPVLDERKEPVEFYKVSGIKKLAESSREYGDPPPWHGICPELETYRERGHRRLDARTYSSKCRTCMWGCRMPVEIIIDNWNPRSKVKYRMETFCYGPLSCKLYKAGPKRQVEGRAGMVYVEEDWVDEMQVAHRGPDE